MALTQIINFTLEVLAPADLSVTIVPITRSVRQGKIASYVVNIESLEEFAGTVDLTVTGLPSPLAYSTSLAAGATAAVPVAIDTTALAVQPYALTLTVVGTEAE